MVKGGHSGPGALELLQEEDPDGHPRVKALTCIWLGRLFLVSFFLPPASLSLCLWEQPWEGICSRLRGIWDISAQLSILTCHHRGPSSPSRRSLERLCVTGLLAAPV